MFINVKKLTILMVLGILIFSTGCDRKANDESAPYDQNLAEYLPNEPAAYSGDSDYYHVVKSIEPLETPSRIQVTVNGEVLDNSTGISHKDYSFQMTLAVDDKEITQMSVGSELNESIFDKVVLLRNPIEVGGKWTFTALNKEGKKVKVDAQILEMDEQGTLKVSYTTKEGYQEERIIKKNLGVTDFIRLVTFNKESTWTGYHLEHEALISSKSQDLPKEISIETKLYSSILGFEQAWFKYISLENEDLLTFLKEESKAMEKIKSLDQNENYAYEFVSFYPYEIIQEESQIRIKIVEQYKDDTQKLSYNQLMITLEQVEEVYKISDFERVE